MPQTRLDEAEPQNTNTVYACAKCQVGPLDCQKYKTAMKGKYMRVLLEHIVGSMWKCPKCKAVYYDSDFQRLARDPKNLCRHCGGSRFKWDPVNRELICVNCGIVYRNGDDIRFTIVKRKVYLY